MSLLKSRAAAQAPATLRGGRRARRSRGWLVETTSRIAGHPVGAVGAVLVSALIGLAAAAPLVSPFDPIAQPARRLLPPGGRYLFGTDEFGRDILSRIIYGSRVSLEVGVISVGIALVLGGLVGLISGYYLGIVDNVVQRVVDIMLAFPTVIMLIAIASVLGVVFPGFPFLAGMRSMEILMRGSFYRSAYEMFYTAVAPADKRAVKSLIDVGADRAGDAVGSAGVNLMLVLAPGRYGAILGLSDAPPVVGMCSFPVISGRHNRCRNGPAKALETRYFTRFHPKPVV